MRVSSGPSYSPNGSQEGLLLHDAFPGHLQKASPARSALSSRPLYFFTAHVANWCCHVHLVVDLLIGTNQWINHVKYIVLKRKWRHKNNGSSVLAHLSWQLGLHCPATYTVFQVVTTKSSLRYGWQTKSHPQPASQDLIIPPNHSPMSHNITSPLK